MLGVERALSGLLGLACLLFVGYGNSSSYKVYEKDVSTSLYTLQSPYSAAKLTITADTVSLEVDGKIVKIDMSPLLEIPNIDVFSLQLGSDGNDDSKLFLFGSCAAEGRVLIPINDLQALAPIHEGCSDA